MQAHICNNKWGVSLESSYTGGPLGRSTRVSAYSSYPDPGSLQTSTYPLSTTLSSPKCSFNMLWTGIPLVSNFSPFPHIYSFVGLSPAWVIQDASQRLMYGIHFLFFFSLLLYKTILFFYTLQNFIVCRPLNSDELFLSYLLQGHVYSITIKCKIKHAQFLTANLLQQKWATTLHL